MHRVTSAAALADPTAQHDSGFSDHTSRALSGLPAVSEQAEADEDADAQEDAPLLQSACPLNPFDGVSASPHAQALVNQREGSAGTAIQETLAILRLAAPVTIQAIAQYGHILSILAAVGHQLGVDEFAAVAVGWTWFNLVRCFCFGLSGAYDTLGSQAHGSNNKAMVMSWGITATAAMLLVNVPISVGLWYAGTAARIFFRQSDRVCQMTSVFCRFLMCGLFPWSLVTILTKFLQVQGQLWAPAMCTVAAIVVHVPTAVALVHCFGLVGAGAAVLIMRSAHLLITIGYTLTMGRRYIRLDHKCEGLVGVHSRIGDIEEPAHAKTTATADTLLPLSENRSLGDATASDPVEHDGQHPPAALLAGQTGGQAQAKASDKSMLPQPVAAQLSKHAKHARQPFKQLQQSQPRQWQQLELQQLPPHKRQTPHLATAWPIDGASQQSHTDDSPQQALLPYQLPRQSRSLPLPHPQRQASVQQAGAHQQARQQHAVTSPFASIQNLQESDRSQQQPQPVLTELSSSQQDLQQGGSSQQLPVTLMGLLVMSLSPKRLWAFLSLGIPGGLASSVEGAAAEVTTALAGVLGTIQIDAHTTMLSVSGVLFTLLGFGFAVGCTIRVGNLLGAQQPAQARLSAVVSLSLGGGTACLVGTIMLLLSRQLGQAFTSDADVLDVVKSLGPVVALFSIFDSSAAILAGALKGMGRQKQLMWVGIAGFWGVGVPVGYALAFPARLALSGLWLGQLAGSLIVAGAQMLMLTRVNWQDEVNKALQKHSQK